MATHSSILALEISWTEEPRGLRFIGMQSRTQLKRHSPPACHIFSSTGQASFNFMASVTIHRDFGAQESNIRHCFYFSPSICHEVMGPDAMVLDFWMLSFKAAFSLSSFTLIKKPFQFLFIFSHYSGIFCISEVFDISPSNPDSSLWFIQPSISHVILSIWVK